MRRALPNGRPGSRSSSRWNSQRTKQRPQRRVLRHVFREQADKELDVVRRAIDVRQPALLLFVAGDLVEAPRPWVLGIFAVIVVRAQLGVASQLKARLLDRVNEVRRR